VGAEASFEETCEREGVGFFKGGGGDADHGVLGELRLFKGAAQGVKSGKGGTCLWRDEPALQSSRCVKVAEVSLLKPPCLSSTSNRGYMQESCPRGG
jgi:hypothetical protein